MHYLILYFLYLLTVDSYTSGHNHHNYDIDSLIDWYLDIMGESCEARIDFIQEFTLKSLRLKSDKWSRMVVSDEQRCFITSFIERG